MTVRSRWLAAPAHVAVADVECEKVVHPGEYYMGAEISDGVGRAIGLSVIVLKRSRIAPDGTIVLFECERPVLDNGLIAIEVPTVSGRASIEVTPLPGEEVWVRFSLPDEIGYSGGVSLPTLT